MIRLIFCARRRADLDPVAFRRDWAEPMREVAASSVSFTQDIAAL